jgi:hypothetical protein
MLAARGRAEFKARRVCHKRHGLSQVQNLTGNTTGFASIENSPYIHAINNKCLVRHQDIN